MGVGGSKKYESKETQIFEKFATAAQQRSGKKIKRDGTVLRGKAEIINDYDNTSIPYPIKAITKLDYCWRLTYTMFKHSFVLAFPLSFIHFIWTRAPECWNYTIRTTPYRAFFRNYFICVMMINAINTTWSLAMEDYW